MAASEGGGTLIKRIEAVAALIDSRGLAERLEDFGVIAVAVEVPEKD